MKKNYFLGAAAAFGLFALASCSNEDDPISPNQPGVEEEAAQEIILQVANTGDGLTTKAGRPLFSSEAKQSIDKVKVIIYDGSKSIVAVKEFDNWMNQSVEYSTDGHGQQATWKLSGTDKLGEGQYSVYAIGWHSAKSDYTDWSTWTGYAKTSTFTNPYILTISDPELGEEVFAGEIAEIKVNSDGEFYTSDLTEGAENNFNVLTLHRQVSGTIGYFTSIPTKAVGSQDASDINNLSVRLVTRKLHRNLALAYFNSDFTENPTNENGDNVWYVVNGYNNSNDVDANANFVAGTTTITNVSSGSKDACVVYSINLKDWFPNGDANNDGLLDSGDYEADPNNWNTPASVTGAEFEPGSVFAGKFLIPVEKTQSQSTLQLQLVDNTKITDNDGGVIRYWNINLAESDPQLNPKAHIYTVDATGAATESDIDEQRDSYSLVRNHLYTIGAKATDDYNPGTDEPEDLSKGQNLILKVNDNWEMIHKMEIE